MKKIILKTELFSGDCRWNFFWKEKSSFELNFTLDFFFLSISLVLLLWSRLNEAHFWTIRIELFGAMNNE